MKIYLVILGHTPDYRSDVKFEQYINANNFDYWHYNELNYILVTPDTFLMPHIMNEVNEAYDYVFNVVLEIDIKDFGGLITGEVDFGSHTPFDWFTKLKEPGFKPKWEREISKDSNI